MTYCPYFNFKSLVYDKELFKNVVISINSLASINEEKIRLDFMYTVLRMYSFTGFIFFIVSLNKKYYINSI